MIKLKSIKKINKQNSTGEVRKKTYDLLLEQKYFYYLRIKTYPHNSLNLLKGVMRSLELSLCTLDEIKTNLCSCVSVTLFTISIKKNDKIIQTSTYILSFNTLKIPSKIKIEYTVTKVEIYIPNPLRCHNCQWFGHHRERCTRPSVCKRYRVSWTEHRTAQTVNKTMQLIQKSVKHRKKRISEIKRTKVWPITKW